MFDSKSVSQKAGGALDSLKHSMFGEAAAPAAAGEGEAKPPAEAAPLAAAPAEAKPAEPAAPANP